MRKWFIDIVFWQIYLTLHVVYTNHGRDPRAVIQATEEGEYRDPKAMELETAKEILVEVSWSNR